MVTVVVTIMLIVVGSGVIPLHVVTNLASDFRTPAKFNTLAPYLASAQSSSTTGFNSLAAYLASAQSPAATTAISNNLTIPTKTTGFNSLGAYLASAPATAGLGLNTSSLVSASPDMSANLKYSPNGQQQLSPEVANMPTQEQLLPYQSSQLGFAIHYPSTWQVNLRPQGVVKFVSQDGSYFVVHIKNAEGMTLHDWTNVEIAWLKDRFYQPPPANASSAQLSDIIGAGATVDRQPLVGHFSLANQPAIALTYKDQDEHPAAKLWTIKNGNVYVITFNAPDPITYMYHMKSVMAMVESLQIL
jgi:hypothetical protein